MARMVAFLFLIVAVATITAVPTSQCGENETFNSCGSKCPATCQNPIPSVCTLACVPGCDCIEGYLRNTQNKCVPVQSC